MVTTERDIAVRYHSNSFDINKPMSWDDLGVMDHPTCLPEAETLNLFLLGKYGTGKSSLIYSRPRNLVLSVENSARFQAKKGAKANSFPINSYQAFHHFVVSIEDPKTAESFRQKVNCITIDTLGLLLPIIEAELLRLHGVANSDLKTILDYKSQGAGVFTVNQVVQKALSVFEKAGFAWIVVDHLIEKTVQVQGTKDTIAMDKIKSYPSLASDVAAKADMVLQVSKKVTESSKMVNGKVFRTKEHRFFVDPEALDSNKAQELKQRVELPGVIDVTDNGWSDFDVVYKKACQDAMVKEGYAPKV